MTFYRTTRLMLSSAAILSFASSAFALDGADLLKKINAAYALQGGGSLTADGIDVDGSTVTLKGASFKPSSTTGAKLGNVTMTGVEEDANGGYHIDKVSFADIAVTQDGTTISATDMMLGDVSIPADATKGGMDSLIIPHKGHTGAVSISKGGKEVLALQESNFNNIVRPDKSGYDMDGAVTGIKADLSDVQDPKATSSLSSISTAA
jgi:hypothetical protein